MYKPRIQTPTSIINNDSVEGETIEEKLRRVIESKEPIDDASPLIYTERKDGVQPEYNIRTDRFEVALDAMSAIEKTHKAKREERQKLADEAKEGMKKEQSGEYTEIKKNTTTPGNSNDKKE